MAPKTQALLLAALLITSPAPTQVVVGAHSSAPGTIRVDVDLVNVLCSVRDKKGTWAQELTRDDFEVREDGKPRPITHFAADTDSPLTVALMVDVSGSVTSILEIERAAGRRFLHEVIRTGDQALIGSFASTITIWQDFTGSAEKMESALDRVGTATDYSADGAVVPRGGTLLYDALDLVADRKLQRVPGRKALIVITDGQDNGSKVKIDDAVKSALAADTVVFAIHYVAESAASRDGRRPLSQLSEPTGGRTFEVTEKMPLERVFAEIADEMRHQYALGFAPANRDGALHKLEVIVKRPGYKPQSRHAFYAR